MHLLTGGLERTLREMNPWWRGEPVPGVAPIRRWAFDPVLSGVRAGLAPTVLLRGPRQVGKTTLQLQVIDQLLREGVDPKRILRLHSHFSHSGSGRHGGRPSKMLEKRSSSCLEGRPPCRPFSDSGQNANS